MMIVHIMHVLSRRLRNKNATTHTTKKKAALVVSISFMSTQIVKRLALSSGLCRI